MVFSFVSQIIERTAQYIPTVIVLSFALQILSILALITTAQLKMVESHTYQSPTCARRGRLAKALILVTNSGRFTPRQTKWNFLAFLMSWRGNHIPGAMTDHITDRKLSFFFFIKSAVKEFIFCSFSSCFCFLWAPLACRLWIMTLALGRWSVTDESASCHWAAIFISSLLALLNVRCAA